MSSVPSPQQIASDARWLVQALDHNAGVARLVEMDRDAYRSASFLDDRMFQQAANAQLVPWGAVAEAIRHIERSDARWIFHIGHVGSTLLARLLGELPNVLSIREPRFLRDVAALPAEDRTAYAAAAQPLFSRTFASTEVALVKATSFVSEIADELVPSRGSALLMYATPLNYIGSILAGENSLQELRMLEALRAERLATRGIALAGPRHDADRAAIAWACEMTSLEAAAEAMAHRRLGWIDFDRMLDDVAATLATSTELLRIPANREELGQIAQGSLLSRYSKALEYEYSPNLRRDLIADASRRHRVEVDQALAMLRSAAEKSALLARALARCGED